MKNRLLLLLSGVLMFAALPAFAQTPCQANINGFKISRVYVTGTSYNAVAWAYKNLSRESCLTPVTNLAHADAILDLVSPPSSGASVPDALTVTCMGGAGDTDCTDSSGDEMSVTCDQAGNCDSYFGPSLASAIGDVISSAVENSVGAAQARIYTLDHKLVWNSEMIKARCCHNQWNDKIRMEPLAPPCKMPGAWGWRRYKNFRHWASAHCGITFGPLVSIDVKANRRIAAEAAKQAEVEQMAHNASAAAKQQPNP